MDPKMTLADFLSQRMNVPIDKGFSFGSIVDRLEDKVGAPCQKAREIAIDLDFEYAVANDENFSLKPLKVGSYSTDEIIACVKEFYHGLGYSFDERCSDLSNWAWLTFIAEQERRINVTLSIYPMDGIDKANHELLVTTEQKTL